jgi:hypothetical protein
VLESGRTGGDANYAKLPQTTAPTCGDGGGAARPCQFFNIYG